LTFPYFDGKVVGACYDKVGTERDAADEVGVGASAVNLWVVVMVLVVVLLVVR